MESEGEAKTTGGGGGGQNDANTDSRGTREKRLEDRSRGYSDRRRRHIRRNLRGRICSRSRGEG